MRVLFIIEPFRKNIRYITAAFFIILTILANRHFFAYKTISSESCANGKCLAVAEEKPSLSNQSPIYYADNLFQTEPGKYYRLIFSEKSDYKSSIRIKVAKSSYEENIIKTIELSKANNFSYQEVFFSTADTYSNLIFEKTDYNDEAKIFIKDLHISELEIKGEPELSNLKPTILGKLDTNIEDQKQAQSFSHQFPSLMKTNSIMGQIFKANSDYISGIKMDMDITKENFQKPKKYQLDFREVNYKGDKITPINNAIFSKKFSTDDLEQYRQSDGKILFPIFSLLKKGEYYLISLDATQSGSNEFNQITLRGTTEDKSYENGTAFIKIGKEYYKIDGDLYFITYGADFSSVNRYKILPGAIIEDLGMNMGAYSYQMKGSEVDMLDLLSETPNITFSGDRDAIYGLATSDSNFVYLINMVYPFKKIHLFANQADPKWNRAKISYSYDNINWQEAPFSNSSELNSFDFDITQKGSYNMIYLKVTPEISDNNSNQKNGSYGITDLKISADLIIK